MKKTLSLILAIFICLTALYACETDTPDTSGSDESIEAQSTAISYDEVSYFIPGGDESATEESQTENSEPNDPSTESSAEASKPAETSKPTETSQPPVQQTGEFEIKSKTYDYEGNNLAILNIKNETNRNYSLTIKASYLDVDNKILKTETQKWEQFASGYQKYFMFRPGIRFDKFTYEIEEKEFHGECPLCNFTVDKIDVKKGKTFLPELVAVGDTTKFPAILAQVQTKNNNAKALEVGKLTLITIGNDGEIFNIFTTGNKRYKRDEESYRTFIIYCPKENDLIWPDVLKGNINMIPIVETN